MGSVSGNNKKFENSKNVLQLVYYTLAIVVISITIWFTFVLPNIDFLTNQMLNSTIP